MRGHVSEITRKTSVVVRAFFADGTRHRGDPNVQADRAKFTATRSNEIEGLRALAVIVVILYHLRLDSFAGGFVGVDVFFVISGYLITRMIFDETSRTNEFSVANFYSRRMRRLFPALAATLLASLLFAVFILNPGDLRSFCGSVVYSIIGLSNYFFLTQAGYFDVGADVKPALHTWSLSVEAQFYVIWPLIIVAVAKNARRWLLPVVLGAALLSLFLNVIYLNDWFGLPTRLSRAVSGVFSKREAFVFFGMPFRIFEFGLGALVLFLGAPGEGTARIRNDAVAAIGTTLILCSSVMFRSTMPFPSFYALAPCAGAALIIWAARDSILFKQVYGNAILVWVGGLSYSLYLTHWPVIVFYRYSHPGALVANDIVAILAMTLMTSLLLNRFVEKPFRASSFSIYRLRYVNIWSCSIVFSALVASVALHGYFSDGWLWRYSTYVAGVINDTNASVAKHRTRSAGCVFTNFKDFTPQECVQPVAGMTNILVLGDSAADYSWIGLQDNLPTAQFSVLQLTPSNCRPGIEWGSDAGEYCKESNRFIFDFISKNSIDLVVLAASQWDYGNLKKTLSYLKSINRKVVLIGAPMTFVRRLPDIVTSDAGTAKSASEIDSIVWRGLNPNTAAAREATERIAREEAVDYFDTQKEMCNDVGKLSTCHFVWDGVLLTGDFLHMTPAASVRFLKPLAAKIQSQFSRP